MTAQIAEKLMFEGQHLTLMTHPLHDYFALLGRAPRFEVNCTALWRGYVGSWEITAERLYLVGLEGSLEGGGPLCLQTLFPGYAERVFAHWYSGTLRVPRGQCLQYVHGGDASRCEFDLLIRVEQGLVLSRHLRSNALWPGGLSPQSDALSAWLDRFKQELA